MLHPGVTWQAASRREDRRRLDELPGCKLLLLAPSSPTAACVKRNGFNGEQREIFEDLVRAVQRKQVGDQEVHAI